MTDIVFHFGQQIGDMMYDYSIDIITWNNLLSEMGKLYDITKSSHVIYQLDHLVYEFSKQDMTYVCYTDTIDPYMGEVELPKLGIKFSHIHYRHRQIIKCDFQPINSYYNVHEVVRYKICFPSYVMIFEEKHYLNDDHTTYEIMYIYIN